jgi:hypothetical protein
MARNFRGRNWWIRGQIEENWKFDGQLGVQLNKSKTKDQNKNKQKWRETSGMIFESSEVKLHAIKSFYFN